MAANILRLALSQLNVTVGDLDGNTAKIIAAIDEAREAGAGMVAFPELAITGYPPEDLLLKPAFLAENVARLRAIASHTRGIVAVVGFVAANDDIHNAAAVLADGRWVGTYHKRYLPNYGVFDEDRYFLPGRQAPVFRFGDVPIGITICEDIWYPVGPATLQALGGARLIVNINGSPYHRGKQATRETMLATRAMDNDLYLAYVNMVGGQDELVFDGGSLILDPNGRVIARVIIMLPWAVSLTMTAIVWRWALNGESGMLNSALRNLGIIDQNIQWLASATTIWSKRGSPMAGMATSSFPAK